MYEHLLVALDGSAAAEQVLDHAEALAARFNSKVTVLRVRLSPEMLLAETATSGPAAGGISPPMDPTPILDAEGSDAEAYLQAVTARLRAKQLDVSSEDPDGSAAEVIVERARALGAGLILMTTHGRGGLGRLVFGSVADSVLRHAPCPVLLVRVHDEG